MTKHVLPAPSCLDGLEIASSAIRPFRLGDYGLLDLYGPLGVRTVQRALLAEWSRSPAGVILRVDPDAPLEDETVGMIAAAAAALVRTWPGTPMGLISESSRVRDLLAQQPHGDDLVIASTLPEVWDGLWARGGKADIALELPPTAQALTTARDVVVRACLDWHLAVLAAPAALLTGDLVARSLTQGAQDIHFTVSRHGSRVRVLARDDVPSTPEDELRTIRDVSERLLPTRAPVGLDGSRGEFALDGHHVRWAVTDARAA